MTIVRLRVMLRRLRIWLAIAFTPRRYREDVRAVIMVDILLDAIMVTGLIAVSNAFEEVLEDEKEGHD